jgi:chemotaxis protein methyltransferase CheR
MIKREDYEFIRNLVYDFSRINLGSDKQELVSARIGKRLRALNLESITDYCHFLRSPDGADELSNLIDVISTNHTFFFREPAHFEFLEKNVIPEMTGPKGCAHRGGFRVWSAASSSGEEVYSLAILLAEQALARPGWLWQIEATDISTRILKRAREAIYPSESVSKVRPDLLKRYFQCGLGPQEGNYRVKTELGSRVTFRHLNLLGNTYPFTDPFHVIFCRNVMIYFDRPTQEELVRRLSERLVPGGYLMVGHSESLTGIRHRLKTVKPAIYQVPV